MGIVAADRYDDSIRARSNRNHHPCLRGVRLPTDVTRFDSELLTLTITFRDGFDLTLMRPLPPQHSSDQQDDCGHSGTADDPCRTVKRGPANAPLRGVN